MDIVEGGKGGQLAEGLIGQVTFGRCVHTENQARKEDMHTRVVAAHKTTTPLTKMGPETVEGDAKRRDVENVANKNALLIEKNDGRTPPQDRSKGIVTHSNAEIPNCLV